MKGRESRLVVVLSIAILVLGCGESGPAKHQVSGSVTWDGVPIAQGFIKFVPAEGDTTLEESLEIKNGSYSGAVTAGPKMVQILASREKASLTPQEEEQKKTMGMAPPESVPADYNANTILTATIAEGTNKFDFAVPVK